MEKICPQVPYISIFSEGLNLWERDCNRQWMRKSDSLRPASKEGMRGQECQRRKKREGREKGCQNHGEKMNWGKEFQTKREVDIHFPAGSTERDPILDAPYRTPEEERAGRHQRIDAALTDGDLEFSRDHGVSIKNIIFRYFLARREDIFNIRDEMYFFFWGFELDLYYTLPPINNSNKFTNTYMRGGTNNEEATDWHLSRCGNHFFNLFRKNNF
ncbi:MAG: hypothetical protein QW261_09775 [Candidatus Jordarchaeaceae archaeon]